MLGSVLAVVFVILIPVCLILLLDLKFSDVILSTAKTDNVVYINILARHGARSPTWFYKNNPNQNSEIVKKTGLGSLLEEGKKQSYNLGLWLQKRYGHLLSDPEKIYVLTTDVERVKQSAKCCLAGLFSSHGSYLLGDEAVDCTTNIKLHPVKSDVDNLIGGHAPCSAYTEEFERVYKSKEIEQKNKEFKEVYTTINTKSGSKGKNGDRFEFIHKIYDIVLVELQEELGLNPDPWAVEIMSQMKKASILSFAVRTWTEKLKRLKSGPLVGRMIKDMEDKVQSRNEMNVKLYYAHDTTIVNFLNTLGVYDMKKLPEYASCVILELIDTGRGKYDVKLYYSQTTKPHVTLLIYKSLEDFVETTKLIVPTDWHKECNAIDKGQQISSS